MQKIHLAIFLILNFFLSTGQTTYFGSPSAVVRSMEINSLKECVQHINSGAVSKNIAENELTQIRYNFWEKFNNGNLTDADYDNYLNALTQKDFYIVMIEFLNSLDGEAETVSGAFNGIGDVWEMLSGGSLDNGIPSYCKNEFNVWVNSFSGIKAFNGSAFTKENISLYESYLKKRNKYEFYIKNQYSPIKIGSSQSRLKAYLDFTEAVSIKSTNEYIAETTLYFTEQEINSALDYIIDYSRLELFSTDDYLAIYDLEFNLSSFDKDNYSIYLIKRRKGIEWKDAKLIYKNRVDKYGNSVIDNLSKKYFENRNSTTYSCVGSPYIMLDNYIRNSNNPPSNCDCFSLDLGNKLLWEDIFSLNYDEIPSVSHYDNLNNTHIKSKFKRAFNLVRKYGANLSHYEDGFPISFEINYSDLKRYSEWHCIRSLLEGMAIIENDYETLLFLSYLYANDYNNENEIQKAVTDTNNEIKSNKDASIEKIKKLIGTALPNAYFNRSFSSFPSIMKQVNAKYLLEEKPNNDISNKVDYANNYLIKYMSNNPDTPEQNQFTLEDLNSIWTGRLGNNLIVFEFGNSSYSKDTKYENLNFNKTEDGTFEYQDNKLSTFGLFDNITAKTNDFLIIWKSENEILLKTIDLSNGRVLKGDLLLKRK